MVISTQTVSYTHLGAVDAAGLIGNDLAVEAVEVVGRVHVQNLLLTVDSSLSCV